MNFEQGASLIRSVSGFCMYTTDGDEQVRQIVLRAYWRSPDNVDDAYSYAADELRQLERGDHPGATDTAVKECVFTALSRAVASSQTIIKKNVRP